MGWKGNIDFVLVEPKEAGNIGASARAIKNMGFKNLLLVNPPESYREGYDFWLACHSTDVLENALVFNTLQEAIADSSLVVGTSRRVGKKRGKILPLREGIKEVMRVAKNNKVSILFGREDRGLTNEEILECAFLMYIPTSEEAPSLNLAQAVMVVAYELAMHEPEPSELEVVTQKELNALFGHIRQTLRVLEYIPRGNRNMEERIMRNMKHLLSRACLSAWEVRMLHGICSQIERKVKDGCN